MGQINTVRRPVRLLGGPRGRAALHLHHPHAYVPPSRLSALDNRPTPPPPFRVSTLDNNNSSPLISFAIPDQQQASRPPPGPGCTSASRSFSRAKVITWNSACTNTREEDKGLTHDLHTALQRRRRSGWTWRDTRLRTSCPGSANPSISPAWSVAGRSVHDRPSDKRACLHPAS